MASVLASSRALAAAACGGDGGLETPPQCNPLGGASCVTPWPSAIYEVDYAGTRTGRRLAIPADALPINIDGALAAVLYDMGFPPTFGRLLFIVGRVAGLSAEVSEELARERPMRIRNPVNYDGTPPRSIE